MRTRLGVDLGTTWTAAARTRADGTTEVVSLGTDGAAMASVVGLDGDQVLAGPAAVRVAATDPSRAVREFKRRLGDTTPLVVGGTPFGAETLMGHLLAHVLLAAGEPAPDDVVLTHPAAWGEYKLDLLHEAGRVAGLGQISLVSEPEAAARHYASLGRIGPGDAVAVYDFGGGTFDAAVVRLTAAGSEVIGQPEGLERLGGIDLDQAVLALVDAAVDGALGRLDRTDAAVRQAVLALREECTRAKEALSADTETSVSVLLPGLDTQVRITRGEFEAAVRPRLEETIGSLERVVASAGLALGDLAGTLLVGGSSRMPVVAELVASRTGRPVLHDADPKLAVCLGAAAPERSHQEEPAMAAATNPPPPDGPRPDAPPAGAPSGAPTIEGAAASAPGGGTGPGGGASGGGSRTGSAATRRTEPGKRPPPKTAGSSASKVAAGLAAAGVAAASFVWRDDVSDAVFGDQDANASDALAAVARTLPDLKEQAAAAAPAAPVAAPASMDAFDGPDGGGGGGGGGGPRGGSSGGGGGGGSRGGGAVRSGGGGSDGDDGGVGGDGITTGVRAQAVRTESDDAITTTPTLDPAFEAARDRIAANLDSWTPPDGADPQEAAALKAHLADMVDNFQPRPGQSVDDAISELRDDFEVRVQNFTQEERLDQLEEDQDREDLKDQIADAVDDDPMTGTMPTGDDTDDRDDLIDQIRDAVDGDDDPLTGTMATGDRGDLIDQIRDAVDDDMPLAATAADTGGLVDVFDDLVEDRPLVMTAADLDRPGIVDGDQPSTTMPMDGTDDGPDLTMPPVAAWDDDDVLGTATVADAAALSSDDDDLGFLTAPAPDDGPDLTGADPLGLPGPDQPIPDSDPLGLDDDLRGAGGFPSLDDQDDLTSMPALDDDQDDADDFSAPDDSGPDLSAPPDDFDDDPTSF